MFYIKKIIPFPLLSLYHLLLSLGAAFYYRFPAQKVFVVGVTGTKGKTTVIELINALLENAGYTTALAGTLRFKIGGGSSRNLLKMTMPGRFFLQRFLRNAVNEGCQYVILEVTSEGTRQWRHLFLGLNALIFTNLSPEHIESHGSYEKYRDAKLSIAKALVRSDKKEKIIVANKDDKEGKKFLGIRVSHKYPFSLEDAAPFAFHDKGIRFVFEGVTMDSPLRGEFNLYNILAAITFAKSVGIQTSVIKQTLQSFGEISGRLEFIREGQDFDVVVDYAHTPDSLSSVYKTFTEKKKLCVLGATGGGRDKWKRREFGEIAEHYCKKVILTNEDPYDENPVQIVKEIQSGISNSQFLISNVSVEMDRRKAIRKAFELANPGDIVLITGKGTDPFIMGPRGSKIPWDDRDVAREELREILNHKS